MNSRELFNEQYMTQARRTTASEILGRIVDAQAHSKLAWSLATGLASVDDKKDAFVVAVDEMPGVSFGGSPPLKRIISMGVFLSRRILSQMPLTQKVNQLLCLPAGR